MTYLFAARALVGTSLAFHIVFAAVGVAMPLLMVIAEWRARRTGSAVLLELARRWAKGTAILFAVGAVSGTVISFELGLFFPRFMAFAGSIIGLPFSLEGFAFFAEAIFLGIYLYGWERVPPRLHLCAGVVVAASGALSAFFVTLANAYHRITAIPGFTNDPRSSSRRSQGVTECSLFWYPGERTIHSSETAQTVLDTPSLGCASFYYPMAREKNPNRGYR